MPSSPTPLLERAVASAVVAARSLFFLVVLWLAVQSELAGATPLPADHPALALLLAAGAMYVAASLVQPLAGQWQRLKRPAGLWPQRHLREDGAGAASLGQPS